MASSSDFTYIQAVAAAEGARQTAVSTAYATFQAASFAAASWATYKTAVATAQQAYIEAVKTAMATLSGASPAGPIMPTYGLSGPIGSNIANLGNGY